jgi:hypothetical protein
MDYQRSKEIPLDKQVWDKGDQEQLVQRIHDEKDTAQLTGLTHLQRSIYLHFLNHKSKRTGQPCLLPQYAGRADRIKLFFTALERLEERGLIVVDRRPANYKSWTISGPR